MISALTGELRRVDEDRLHLQVGPMLVEMLLPASDVPLLQAATGQEMTFHTIFYFEGDGAGGGGLEPRLVGFLRPEDKRFFEKFITVKGIGPKKALKALIYPAGEVAQAIESKDTRFLVGLPQIGKRMAEQIVAELAGKVAEFATAAVGGKMNAAAVGGGRRSEVEEDAISTLMALGERRHDAEHLLDRARQHNGNLKTTEALVREMLRMRTVRA
ncbi:MAG TPA: Holliday junction branch migration protein RuvA [Tepidisphaeraceae bacterium]|nr:Holliday junction branch migration protein RuvA [Tepidisphaeraceae bacterium]